MHAQIAPEWKKVHTSLEHSMEELDEIVREIDKHHAGKVLARKAQEAQNGPYRKILDDLEVDIKMVNKALDANKKTIDSGEAKVLRSMMHEMLSEGSEVWDTHAGIVDDKKADQYAKRAIKEWNDNARKFEDKMVKKIVSKSKIPARLAALAKALHGVSQAQQHFMGHNGKFNRAYLRFEDAAHHVADDVKHVADTLKHTEAAVEKMHRETF